MEVITEPVWRALSDVPEILQGIKSKIYTVHGGVIRHAPGSELGGRIVAHLKLPSGEEQASKALQSLTQTIQAGMETSQSSLSQIQGSLQLLQGLQVANVALSGLNLAVSVAGFAIVCNKLNKISEKIEQQKATIQKLAEGIEKAADDRSITKASDFAGLVKTTIRACRNHDIEQLKTRLFNFDCQYEYHKLVLLRQSGDSELLALSSEGELLQQRLMFLGMMRAHVHRVLDRPREAAEDLAELSADMTEIHGRRIDTLVQDREFAVKLPETSAEDIFRFLEETKGKIAAVNYEAELLALELERPGVLTLPSANDDQVVILMHDLDRVAA